jgi:hypothetical protein
MATPSFIPISRELQARRCIVPRPEPDRKSPKEWTELLGLDSRPVTLEEYQAAIASRALGAQFEAAAALKHLEGMIGAIDDFLAQAYPGLYPGSAKIRKALEAQRSRELQALMLSKLRLVVTRVIRIVLKVTSLWLGYAPV